MTPSQWIKLGAIVMFISVVLGAFGAHGLKNVLSDYEKSIFETAVRYQMIHGLSLFLIAWLSSYSSNPKLTWAGYCFLIGILLFSGSLYALSLSGLKILGAVTPLGGLAFLGGWLLILLSHV